MIKGIKAFVGLLVYVLFVTEVQSTKLFELALFYYNGWDMPFSAYMAVTPTTGLLQGSTPVNMQLDMDMSAYFSVIFSTDPTIEQTSSIIYSINELASITLDGSWQNCEFEFGIFNFDSDGVIGQQEKIIVTQQTFIAYSKQINGLDGIVGMAPVMGIPDLLDYSFLSNLALTTGTNIEAMSYNITVFNHSLYEGTMIFYSDTTDITEGATSLQLDSTSTFDMSTLINSYVSADMLAAFASGTPSDGVNPFITYNLNSQKIYSWYIGSTRMLDGVSNYPHTMNLTSSMSGILVEQNFYEEFYQQFITQICNDNPYVALSENNIYSGIQFDVSKWQCSCNGGSIEGMPNLFMDMGSPKSSVFMPGKKTSYKLTANDYTLFPQITFGTRGQMCAMGLQNLGYKIESQNSTAQSMEQFTVGKSFIRKFPLAMTFTSASTSVAIAITGPSDNSDFVLDIVMISATVLFLYTFVCCMSRKRQARYQKERKMFFKLKELQEEDPNITVEMFRLKQTQKNLIQNAKDGKAGTIEATEQFAMEADKDETLKNLVQGNKAE